MRTTILLCALALTGCGQVEGLAKGGAREQPGRWSIVHSPHVVRDTMLLDTATGNTWQLVKLGDKDDAGVGWQFVGKIDDPHAVAQDAGWTYVNDAGIENANKDHQATTNSN